MLGRARASLDGRDRSRPFLAWVHLFDAHDPHEPPPEFPDMCSAYSGEVAYMDRELGKLFEVLRADGTLERTLVIVLGDHGEGLNEHSEVTHGWFCYGSTVRVPMLVRFPDGRRKGERSKESVSVVDVFPSALSALGLEPPRDIDGASLDHALLPESRGVYFECFNGAENFGWSPLVGWADVRAKYIHSSAPELFDLERDRQEQRKVLAERSADAARMLAEIRRVRSGPALVCDRDESVNPRRSWPCVDWATSTPNRTAAPGSIRSRRATCRRPASARMSRSFCSRLPITPLGASSHRRSRNGRNCWRASRRTTRRAPCARPT